MTKAGVEAAQAAKKAGKGTLARRLVKWSAIAAGASVALLVIFIIGMSWYIETAYVAVPPTLDGTPAVLSMKVVRDGDTRRIGDAWLAKRDGILRMYIAGDPFTLGYSNASLSQDYVEEQEATLIGLIKTRVPSPVKLWLLRKYVIVRNRDLPRYVNADLSMEIYGLSRGVRDPFPEIGPLYHRLLNYHAAHDISHAVMDHPLVGCTSFAARGKATADGHLIVGRNFDFDAGKCFDTNKIVMRVKPDKGYGFISVGWPGLVGVVTGLNDKKISISINAAQSTDVRRIGTPVSLVMRQVMQYAATLDEAVEIIRKSEVFVSDCYLLADGKTGEAAVVEKTPLRTQVRRMDGDHIVCSNQFMTAELAGDARNILYMKEGTSVARYDRMEALVKENAGRIDPVVAAGILRDRALPGGVDGGLGNPAALNSLVATHSVITDATAGVIWVSAAPHQLGAYLPFSLEDFDEPKGVAAIPADPLLSDPAYESFEKCREESARAQSLLSSGDVSGAESAARAAVELDPGLYMPRLILGRVAFAKRDWAAAKAHLAEARARYTPYESERALIEDILARIAEGERAGKK